MSNLQVTESKPEFGPTRKGSGVFDTKGIEVRDGDYIECHQAKVNFVYWTDEFKDDPKGAFYVQNYHAGALPLAYCQPVTIIGNDDENPELAKHL